jgi:hypothetical protein
MSAEREVRVRPDFVHLYPELAADVWLPARRFAEVIVARASLARRHGLRRRTLDPRHFEFRGRALEPRSARSQGGPTERVAR